MRKTITLVLVLGITAGAVFAATGETASDETKVTGKVVTSTQTVMRGDKSSKFFEYRDVPKGFVLGWVGLGLKKGDFYLDFTARGAGQNDARYGLSLGSYGTFKLDFTLDKIPHRFSDFGRSLYFEASPGTYILADQIQVDAQNAVGDGGVNSRNNIGLGRAIVSNFLSGAMPVDLALRRDKNSLDFTYNPTIPVTVHLKASRENRKGTRPFGASLGFSHVIEVPEPISYQTDNLQASVQYAHKLGVVQAGYSLSVFENNIQTLRWDNPYRITDQTFETPSGAYSNGNGTSLGQMALPPSNTAGQFFLNGSIKALKSTRIYGSLSYGVFSQNEPLLPYTVNTSLVDHFPNALSAPRETAEAKANVTSVDLSVSSRLMKGVHVNAGYRYYGFHNKTEELDMSTGYTRFDQNWEDVPVHVEPYTYTRTRIFGDLTWNFWKTTSLKVGYTHSATARELGEEDEGESDEGTFKASLDTSPVDWLILRVSYLNGKREWSEDGHKDIYAAGFNFKRYFEASRDRNAVNVMAGFSPVKNLDLQLSYMMGKDKYPKSDYGLLNDDFTSFSLDASYALGNMASLYGFFSNEVYEGLQKSRQSGSTFSTDTQADWSADIKDTINTFGGGVIVPLVKDKLDLDLSYTYSKADGTSDLYSPPGGSPDLAVNFDQPLDTTTLNIAKVRLTYRLMTHLSLAVGYWYEQYKLEDIHRNDWKVDLINPGVAIYLGALEPGYSYSVAFLKFIWTF